MAEGGRYKDSLQGRTSGGTRGGSSSCFGSPGHHHDRQSVTNAPPRRASRRRGRIPAVAARAFRLLAPAILGALLSHTAPAGADDEVLTIGVLATLEGAFAPLGQDAVRGHELAMAEHEARAGGRPLEALVESTDGTPESVTAKARALIERGASVIIGPLAGIEGTAIRDFAKSVPQVTFVNGASASPDATLRTPAENFFRFNPDSMQWIGGLGRHAYERKGIRTVVAVAEDYSLSHTQLMGFMLEYCSLGGQVLDKHWVTPGTSDTARLAATVARTEADALFLGLSPRVAERFLDAYAEAGGEAAIVAGSTTLNSRLLAAAPATRSLLRGAVSALPVSEGDDNEALAAFVERYRERFPDLDRAPSLFALAYYVNTRALLLALDEAGGVLDDGHERLRAALAGLRLDTPLGGPVWLDESRQAVASAFIVEVSEEADGSLVQRTAHVEPAVGQTFGLPRDAFLSLGPPSRHSPACSEGVAYDARPDAPETDAAADMPDQTPADEPAPEAEEDRTEDAPEVAVEAPVGHPLLRKEKEAAMTTPAPHIVPCLSYRDAPAAIAWLKEAFGFTETMVVPGPDDTIAHAQLSFGSGMIMVGSERDDALALSSPCAVGGVTQAIYVVVEDADARYAQAVLAGAEIVRELEDTPYGSRDFSAKDPEGHLWHFGTYRPDMAE